MITQDGGFRATDSRDELQEVAIVSHLNPYVCLLFFKLGYPLVIKEGLLENASL